MQENLTLSLEKCILYSSAQFNSNKKTLYRQGLFAAVSNEDSFGFLLFTVTGPGSKPSFIP